jgi:hypothetical protein
VKKPAKIAEGVEKEARGVTLGDFAESLLGSSALADWPRFISRLKSSCASSGGAGAVRLPIGNLLPAELQVQTWLSWLSREGAFEGATPVGSLVSRAGGRSRAVLFFRDLRPEDFLLLHPEATDYEFVEETTTVSGAAGEPGAPEEAAAEPPAAPPSQPGWNEPLTAFLHPEKGEA